MLYLHLQKIALVNHQHPHRACLLPPTGLDSIAISATEAHVTIRQPSGMALPNEMPACYPSTATAHVPAGASQQRTCRAAKPILAVPPHESTPYCLRASSFIPPVTLPPPSTPMASCTPRACTPSRASPCRRTRRCAIACAKRACGQAYASSHRCCCSARPSASSRPPRGVHSGPGSTSPLPRARCSCRTAAASTTTRRHRGAS